jgi:hypothetical protein
LKIKNIKFNLQITTKQKRLASSIDKKLSQIIKEDLPFFKVVKRFVIFSGGKRIRPLTHYYFCNYSIILVKNG